MDIKVNSTDNGFEIVVVCDQPEEAVLGRDDTYETSLLAARETLLDLGEQIRYRLLNLVCDRLLER